MLKLTKLSSLLIVLGAVACTPQQSSADIEQRTHYEEDNLIVELVEDGEVTAVKTFHLDGDPVSSPDAVPPLEEALENHTPSVPDGAGTGDHIADVSDSADDADILPSDGSDTVQEADDASFRLKIERAVVGGLTKSRDSLSDFTTALKCKYSELLSDGTPEVCRPDGVDYSDSSDEPNIDEVEDQGKS